MADNKSCEEKHIASKEASFVRNTIVERKIKECRSLTPFQIDTILGISKEYKEPSECNITTLECMECGYREVFTERQFKFTDGLSCYVCNGPVNPSITRPGEKIRNRQTKKWNDYYGNPKKRSVGSLTIDVDCSDAIKGLKAVQREAKKATAALKELNQQKKKDKKVLVLKIDDFLSDKALEKLKNEVKQGLENGQLFLCGDVEYEFVDIPREIGVEVVDK